jgi:NAD(P)-dependent dehydrogenase (short-subunit alcohol dehydrogenase family)
VADPKNADPMRTLVVGASSGVGRIIGIGLARRGARVALLARRRELLDTAAEEAGPEAFGVVCDVTDESSCQTAVATAVSKLGGIDALVYATGMGQISRLADTDAALWRRTLDTNVIGAALITNAAIEPLRASAGTAAYLSSVAASFLPPFPGLGAYAVSKAALDKLVEAWRMEHPHVGFTRVVLGDCNAPSEFANGWDTELAAEIMPLWVDQKLLSGALIDVEQLVSVVDAVLRGGASLSVPSVTIAPRPVAPTSQS